MQSLPSHQHLLTSLIETLEASALSDAAVRRQSSPADRRRLLLTFHVLFPTLLLPALDLLDRRLVTRVSIGPAGAGANDASHQEEATAAGTAAETVQDAGHDVPPTLQPPLTGALGTYIVRSVATTLTRRTRDALATSASGSSSRTYLVRLDAWHCSCASFALEAFPARPVPTDMADERKSGGDWVFGGQRPGGLGGNAPCCKHLLACLLARKCNIITGSQVEHRIVSKEELAGIVADM